LKDECIMDAQQQRQLASATLPPESDQYFERVTRIAPRALNSPMSVVCLDNLGQPEVIGASGCEREVVFHVEAHYRRTLECEEPFVARDASPDPKLAQGPLATGEPGICLFAGIALRLPCGKPTGVLCVMHTMPRRFTRQQRQMLVDMGQMIEHEVGLRQLDSPDRLQVLQAINRLQPQHALYVETFYRTPAAIAHIGRDWEWRRMNDACVKFFAHSRAPLTKTNILDLLDVSDRTSLEQAVQALNRGRGVEALTLDVTFRLRNRRSKPARVQVALKQAAPTRDGGWLFVIHDTQAEQREKTRAMPGRLRRTGQHMRPRKFTVLLTGPAIDGATLEKIAQAILLTFTQPITFGAKVVQLSASIGMLLRDQAVSLSGEALLRMADAAMYRAKVAGKARIVVHELHDSPAGMHG
jgi:diguanylate cyclase